MISMLDSVRARRMIPIDMEALIDVILILFLSCELDVIENAAFGE
jgi:hypothetical protein